MNPSALDKRRGYTGKVDSKASCSRFSVIRSKRAFTLIEIIGVVAILAIIASIIAPTVAARFDAAARARDSEELDRMAAALQTAILRTNSIPDAAGMVNAIAGELGMSTEQVTNNSRHIPRLIVIDPNLWIGSANNKLPYDQALFPGGTRAAGGAAPGDHLRLMILSSLSTNLPAAFNFDTAWQTPPRSVPSDWAWPGTAEDLCIERIDLSPLFHRLILNKVDTSACYYSIESGGVASAVTNIAPGNILDSWYLERTVVCLYDNDTTAPKLKTVIQKDASFVFELRAWHDLLAGWQSTRSDAFTSVAESFSQAPRNPVQGNTPALALSAFYAFMVNYNHLINPGGPDSMTTLVTNALGISNITASLDQ